MFSDTLEKNTRSGDWAAANSRTESAARRGSWGAGMAFLLALWL
ncbi:hypothetical protein FM119_09185 [Mycetocola reblochoni REB411]|uniref:Uncharacterized protein n=1 Tax=Mycetocola reblochoni REB411 TaxID=1255698 RepID=A0A1R4JSA0_9MICO|nr:hypothetical protein FM119_09185 [Mycetocola reblochoni REB411]